MHKVDGPGNVSGTFVPGNPSIGQAATVVTPAWANAVQEEISNVIEYTAAPLNKLDNTQLLTAVLALVASATAAVPIGVSLEWNFSTAPAGYLMEDGKTIGNATSGATSRANADTITLYTGLWKLWSNTELPIQDSSGNPAARGASASADFAAGKRLPLPDSRGRVAIGKDDMGGSAASRITNAISGISGTTLGASGGDQRMQQHTHAATVTDPTHSHTVPALSSTTIQGGAYTTPFTGSPNTTVTTSSSATGVTVSNANAGAGSSQNVQPGIVKNKIIKY